MADKIEPIEIKEFLAGLISSIEDGVDIEKRSIDGTIKVEISIEKVIKRGGDIKAYVVEGGASASSNKIAKVTFALYPRQSQRSINEIEEVSRHNEEEAEKWRY